MFPGFPVRTRVPRTFLGCAGAAGPTTEHGRPLHPLPGVGAHEISGFKKPHVEFSSGVRIRTHRNRGVGVPNVGLRRARWRRTCAAFRSGVAWGDESSNPLGCDGEPCHIVRVGVPAIMSGGARAPGSVSPHVGRGSAWRSGDLGIQKTPRGVFVGCPNPDGTEESASHVGLFWWGRKSRPTWDLRLSVCQSPPLPAWALTKSRDSKNPTWGFHRVSESGHIGTREVCVPRGTSPCEVAAPRAPRSDPAPRGHESSSFGMRR